MGLDIVTWLRVLRAHGFRVDPRYWLKALFMTGNIAINAPLQAYEYWRYKKAIAATPVEKPLFILGHHRSGTTFLH
ncbi:MAG: sulfotransferase [Bacteroidia bacterium]|nr:sulfotransferase [Bacteroidia bacterium]